MANYQPLKHPRKISEIADGEISLWGSSDGGTTWYPVKVTTDGKIYVTNDDLEALVADSFYKSTKLAFDATDNLTYVGKNTDPAAADGDTDWDVWKFTWAAGAVSGYVLTAKQGPVTGSWTGRAALF